VYARMGGDEFVVLLTGTGEDFVTQALGRFQLAVDVYNEESARGYDLKFSAGYAIKRSDEDSDIDALMERADEKMYEQKNGNKR
jgi:diguanylate cyclase (GGDEF)-like protein